MGVVVKTSESPFPGVPEKPSLQPQQAGEVLIRYELEAAGGCQLNLLGWCCFGALVCTVFPLSWLPFACHSCKKHYQRPVYGYPMSTMSFLATDAGALCAAKTAASSTIAAPAILCMDATLEMQSLPGHDQQQASEQWLQQQLGSPQPFRGVEQTSSCPCSPPPPGIFVPPSVVPVCGFTPEHPFPVPMGSPVPLHLRGSPDPMPFTANPKVLGTCGPAPQTPGPGAGLPVMGGRAFGLSM